jgi:hypothetical protein
MGFGLAGTEGAMALQTIGECSGHPKLKELVVEASAALARLDADRLEELALSCQALNRDLPGRDPAQRDGNMRQALVLESREAAGDMAVFARVLEVTRANLNVINRLRKLRVSELEYRAGRLQYGGPQASGWRRMESRHGDN